MRRLLGSMAVMVAVGCGTSADPLPDSDTAAEGTDTGPGAEDDAADGTDGDGTAGGDGDGDGDGDGPDSDGDADSGSDSDSDSGEPAVCETDASFPAPEWPTGNPEDFGLDPAALEEAAEYAGDNSSNCMVVIRNGHLVFERYWNGTEPDEKVKSWSVAKSYASTLAGIAFDRGDLDMLGDSVADYLPDLAGTPKEPITLHHLLSMSSGLYMDLIDDNVGITGAPDMSQKAIDAEVTNAPGQLWEYNNHAVQLLEPILRAQTGIAPDEYAREHLWEPITMEAEWIQDDEGQPALYQNVLASCRDHAKFGYLFLHNGCWDGEQIVSEEWVETATHSSQPLNPGYGYYWWLSGESPTLDSTDFSELPGGSLHPFGPDDSYCAVGLGSQFIEVIPEYDMVVVRMGLAPQDDPSLWLQPLLLLEALLEDGKQVVHNDILERVLNAVVE